MILVLQQAGACAARNPLHGLLGANPGESQASSPTVNRAVSLIEGQNGCLVDHAGHWQTAHQNGGPGFCVQPQNDPQAYPWKILWKNPVSIHESNHAWIPAMILSWMTLKTSSFGDAYWRLIRHCRNVWAAR